MMGDGPIPDITAGASFGTALRIALCTVVIVSRRSAGSAARNSSRVGSVFGMRRGCAPDAQRSNMNKWRAGAASGRRGARSQMGRIASSRASENQATFAAERNRVMLAPPGTQGTAGAAGKGSAPGTAELGRLRGAEELIIGHEAAEDVAAVAVKDPGPPHVMVEESQGGAERQRPGQHPQAAPAGEAGLQPGPRAIARCRCRLNARFPAAVPVVLLDPGCNVGKCVVLHLRAQVAGRALQQHVLMDLVVAAARVPLESDALVPAEAMAEEAQVPAGIIAAVSEPSVHEPEPAVDV